MNSTNGMKTTIWGPAAWTFLFCSVLGAYPVKLDETNKDHIKIRKEFKNMFVSFGYTMPCFYCRESYKSFTKEMPIDDCMGSRSQLLHWLYKLKDQVNKKLIKQELMCYTTEHSKLIEKYNNNKITKDKYMASVKQLKASIFITKSSPQFNSVISKYDKYRAGCSKKSKMCR